MATTTAVRTSKDAAKTAKDLTAKINKLRKKDKLEPLSQSQVIAFAIEKMAFEMGVSK